MSKNTELAKKLESKLNSVDGFKLAHGGGLFGGKAKKSFAVWSAADKRAVLPLQLLADFQHADNDGAKSFYGIYAFSTAGEINDKTLAQLQQLAKNVDIGTVRYESAMYSRLELWRGPEKSFLNQNKNIATSLGDIAHGLFVFPLCAAVDTSASGAKKLDKPVVIWAEKDGENYIFPVSAKTLEKI